jgi:hypothetical protein
VIENAELLNRLLDDARSYDPTAHTRGLLAPYREVLLLQRAKFMSYEQIAATLTRHGLKVSPAGVGLFCRRTFTKEDIEGLRRHLSAESAGRGVKSATSMPTGAAAPRTTPTPETPSVATKRGPKIARDNY